MATSISFLSTVTTGGLSVTSVALTEQKMAVSIPSVTASLSHDTKARARTSASVFPADYSSSPFTSTQPSSRQSEWWQQLFGFSSELMSEDSRASSTALLKTSMTWLADSAQSLRLASKTGSSDVASGSIMSQDWRAIRFTAEKAKRLRNNLKDADTWHDTMYHSGIATRLAQPK